MERLVEKVLRHLEPDKSRWAYWMESKDLFPISSCEAMKSFVLLMKQTKENRKKIIVAGDYDCGVTRFQ